MCTETVKRVKLFGRRIRGHVHVMVRLLLQCTENRCKMKIDFGRSASLPRAARSPRDWFVRCPPPPHARFSNAASVLHVRCMIHTRYIIKLIVDSYFRVKKNKSKLIGKTASAFKCARGETYSNIHKIIIYYNIYTVRNIYIYIYMDSERVCAVYESVVVSHRDGRRLTTSPWRRSRPEDTAVNRPGYNSDRARACGRTSPHDSNNNIIRGEIIEHPNPMLGRRKTHTSHFSEFRLTVM